MDDPFTTHTEHPYHARKDVTEGSVTGSFTSLRCADSVRMDLVIVGDCIAEAWHYANGCLVSRAGASLLCELIEGCTIARAKSMDPTELLKAFGFELTPLRQVCACTALHAMQGAIREQ